MEKNDLEMMTFRHGSIYGGTLMKNEKSPDQGNVCLHVSRHPDQAMTLRKELARQTVPLSRWVLPYQKHTDQIIRANSAQASRGAFDHEDSLKYYDAIYTTEPDLLIGVFTADCLGILLSDPKTGLVAAVHSGWKGTAQAILYKTLERLKKENLLRSETLEVHFAPSLQYDSLEVGPEVVSQIEQMASQYGLDLSGCISKGEDDRFFIDNQEINIRMLEAFRIPKENIHPCFRDTKTDDACFSFRKDKKLTGEHFSFIYREKLPEDTK